MAVIVRALWGADSPVSRWRKTTTSDIPRCVSHTRAPQVCYVYGRANADFLTRRKQKNVVLLDDDPWPDGCEDVQRNLGNDFYRPWHLKWQIIERAVADHGEVIYCNWDVFCMESDVARIFDRLAERPLDFTLSLNCYSRPQRLPWRDRADRYYCAGGYWIHTRSDWLPRQMLRRMSADPAGMLWHDELVLSALIDELHDGRWPGLTTWLERYESPIMVPPLKRSPWPITVNALGYVERKTPIPFRWERIFRAR